MRPHPTPSRDLWDFLLAALPPTPLDRTSLSVSGKGGVRDRSWASKPKLRGTQKSPSPIFRRWAPHGSVQTIYSFG